MKITNALFALFAKGQWLWTPYAFGLGLVGGVHMAAIEHALAAGPVAGVSFIIGFINGYC